MNQFFKCHQYNPPTLKTKVLRFASKEQRVKYLLLLYKRTMQPYLIGDAFCHSHQYNIPTFKTKVRRLVSHEGLVKRLLLLYKWIIQHYLILL